MFDSLVDYQICMSDGVILVYGMLPLRDSIAALHCCNRHNLLRSRENAKWTVYHACVSSIEASSRDEPGRRLVPRGVSSLKE